MISYRWRRPLLAWQSSLFPQRPHRSSVSRHTAAVGSLRPPSMLGCGFRRWQPSLISPSEPPFSPSHRESDSETDDWQSATPRPPDPEDRHTSTLLSDTEPAGNHRWTCSWEYKWLLHPPPHQCRNAAEESGPGKQRGEERKKILSYSSN